MCCIGVQSFVRLNFVWTKNNFWGSAVCSIFLGLCHAGLFWRAQGNDLEMRKLGWPPVRDPPIWKKYPNFGYKLRREEGHAGLSCMILWKLTRRQWTKTKILQLFWEWAHPNSFLAVDARGWARPNIKIRSSILPALVSNATCFVILSSSTLQINAKR